MVPGRTGPRKPQSRAAGEGNWDRTTTLILASPGRMSGCGPGPTSGFRAPGSSSKDRSNQLARLVPRVFSLTLSTPCTCEETRTLAVKLTNLLACSSPHAQSLSHVQLFATPWTITPQAPLATGFSRQKYWSGLPFPSPGDLLDPRIKARSPALEADSFFVHASRFFTIWPTREASACSMFSHSLLDLFV